MRTLSRTRYATLETHSHFHTHTLSLTHTFSELPRPDVVDNWPHLARAEVLRYFRGILSVSRVAQGAL